MRLPKSFTKQVFIRLEGGEAFASTVKYGCFHSKTQDFKVDRQASGQALPEMAPPKATYLVPPMTMPPSS